MTITFRSRRLLLASVVGLLALAGVAFALASTSCGDDSPARAPGVTGETGQPTTATATVGQTSPTAPPPTATVEAASTAEAARKAALRYFDATDDAAICKPEPPRKQACIYHDETEKDSPERGVAAFGLGFAEGGGALVVFGRDQAGGWQFWFGTQQGVYHALSMPAEMRVCADGQGANVRTAPDVSAKTFGTLKDGAIVTATQFVLTEPGSNAPQSANGNGWYQVTGEFNGFVRADLLSVTTLKDCELRNALVAVH